MTSPEYPDRTCNGETERWCALAGLRKSFNAHAAFKRWSEGLDPIHPYQDLRDEAASFIGRHGCAHLSTIVTAPEAVVPTPEPDYRY